MATTGQHASTTKSAPHASSYWLHHAERRTLALTCSATVVWEWAEFVSDHFFGTHAQVDLTDTMKDMLMGSLGGLTLAAVTLLRSKPQQASASPATPV